MINFAEERWWIPFSLVGIIPSIFAFLIIKYFSGVDEMNLASFLPICSVILGTGIIVMFLTVLFAL